MQTIMNIWNNGFRAREIKGYVVFVSVTFWGIILIALSSYPSEHHYSIMTHTFSFMGSFEPQHNPQYWWIFSIAMLFWGTASLPMVAYIYRRFSCISVWGARVGAALFTLGCFGVMMVALFPDAHGNVIGNLEWTDIHEKAAISVAICFALGIPWHGILILLNRLVGIGGDCGFNHRRLIWPYLFWVVIFSTAAYFLIQWEHIYAAKKAAAAVAGTPIGSSWSEALNTRYSFPLWENLLIYTLFILLAWLTLAIPNEIPAKRES